MWGKIPGCCGSAVRSGTMQHSNVKRQGHFKTVSKLPTANLSKNCWRWQRLPGAGVWKAASRASRRPGVPVERHHVPLALRRGKPRAAERQAEFHAEVGCPAGPRAWAEPGFPRWGGGRRRPAVLAAAGVPLTQPCLPTATRAQLPPDEGRGARPPPAALCLAHTQMCAVL